MSVVEIKDNVVLMGDAVHGKLQKRPRQAQANWTT